MADIHLRIDADKVQFADQIIMGGIVIRQTDAILIFLCPVDREHRFIREHAVRHGIVPAAEQHVFVSFRDRKLPERPIVIVKPEGGKIGLAAVRPDQLLLVHLHKRSGKLLNRIGIVRVQAIFHCPIQVYIKSEISCLCLMIIGMELFGVNCEDMRCLILPARLRPVKIDFKGSFTVNLISFFMFHILDVGMILIQKDYGIGQFFGLIVTGDDLCLRAGIDRQDLRLFFFRL